MLQPIDIPDNLNAKTTEVDRKPSKQCGMVCSTVQLLKKRGTDGSLLSLMAAECRIYLAPNPAEGPGPHRMCLIMTPQDNASENTTLKIEFHLQAFTSYADIWLLIFIIIILMYLVAAFGNIIIILLVCLVQQLHTPMYFFLCNLAAQDILQVSSILPRLLVITMTGDTSISFLGCITQMFMFAMCACTDFLLLTSMAYDRYVAICVPLHYSLIMNKRACALLSTTSWCIGILNSLMQSLLVTTLTFKSSQQVNHYFCELKTLIERSSSDTTGISTFISVECVFLGFLPFLLITASYVCIISTILKIQTSTGRVKAFSKCSSHLTIVIIFCGTAVSLYIKPGSQHSEEEDKLLSLLYVAVVPMLNPLVYSLRNKDVLKALNKISNNMF
ncbi:olfactory receptor 5V1-like [Bombina bombina]|uniref:olfactory receptor 5V1-like n=1 Tax=Bombina bombina TaxID=8345 RepID=UPI00235B183E|nr:olfactory receptor 5V1-like [Bombina bombina]